MNFWYIESEVQYFNIGEKNLRKLVANNPTEDYILMVGNKIFIKCKIFEQFIDVTGSI
ncbi:MAG: excisionase [Eubacterium sp.]|nr:excisionase [Eubacterium sp.]